MINDRATLIDPEGEKEEGSYQQTPAGKKLLVWLNTRLDVWRDHRRIEYEDKWEEYYRIWRGIWDAADKQRASERSRLISPATQQAVEATVAELEEATFGRGQWFDIQDDYLDKDSKDIEYLKNVLREDCESNKVPTAIAEAYLNASIYGTGIAELVVEESTRRVPSEQQMMPGVMARGIEEKPVVAVKWKSISPFNFLIDPTSTSVDESLGVAIETSESIHRIVQKIQDGTYFDAELGNYSEKDKNPLDDTTTTNNDKIKVTKYYGLVPKNLVDAVNNEENGEDGIEEEGESLDGLEENCTEIDADDELIECIVVIANDDVLLKAIPNPYMMQDRPIIAFPLDKIPDRFWGRGIVEKGYNAQKALDAELRSRIDALALTTHPMMAIDATRLPRGAKFTVQPGQTLMSNGNPHEVFMPFTFGQLAPTTFNAAADFERMVQMGTGAIDTAAPTGINGRNSTASGMSMMQGAALKRQKRAVMNVQYNFLIPGIQKTAYRYMQFDTERYPIKDIKFIPTAAMGIMAREYEQQMNIQLLSMTQQGSPLFMLLIKNIFENSSMGNREEALATLAQMSQPNPQEQQAKQQMMQMEMADKQATVEYKNAQKQQLIGQLMIEEQRLKLDAALAQQDKSPKDPVEVQLKVADMALREKQINHQIQKEVAQLAQADQELSIKEKDMMAKHAQAAMSAMPVAAKESAPIHLNVQVDAKSGNTKKKVNRDGEGNITSIEDM